MNIVSVCHRGNIILIFTGDGARRHLTISMHYHALLKEVYCRYIRHLDMIYTISNNRYIYSLFT